MTILISFLAIIVILLIWAWILRIKEKPKEALIIQKIVVSIVLAIPFFIISVAVLIVALWGGGRPYREFDACGSFFYIVNNSSIPLRVSANVSYTPEELEKFKERGVEIDLTINFVDYDVLIPSTDKPDQSYYGFNIPMCWGGEEWPSEVTFVISDTLGKELARYYTNSIDSTMRINMNLEITDSILQSVPEVMIPEHKMWWREEGEE